MAIAINGSSNTITGLAVGGLPDGIVDADMLAANAVTAGKLASGAGGKLLQIVHVTKTDTASIASTSYSDITGMAASITPANASNKIIACFSLSVGGVNNVYGSVKCQRLIAGGSYADLQVADQVGSHHDRANTFIDTEVSYGQYKGYSYSFSLQDTSHNTTSQITYKLVWKAGNGTGYINRKHIDQASYSSAGTSSVMLMEVAA